VPGAAAFPSVIGGPGLDFIRAIAFLDAAPATIIGMCKITCDTPMLTRRAPARQRALACAPVERSRLC